MEKMNFNKEGAGDTPERTRIIAYAFGKKPYEEFKFRCCDRQFRITPKGLEMFDSKSGKWYPDNLAIWMSYAEIE